MQIPTKGLSAYLIREVGPFVPFLLIGLFWDFGGLYYVGLEFAGLALYFATHPRGTLKNWLKAGQGFVYVILYHLIFAAHVSHQVTHVSDVHFALGVSLAVWVLGWLGYRFYRPDPTVTNAADGCSKAVFKVILGLMIANFVYLMAAFGGMTVLADWGRDHGWALLAGADAIFLLLGLSNTLYFGDKQTIDS
jgi:hypothetical protein